MTLPERAAAYLLQEQSGWLRLARALAKRVSEWVLLQDAEEADHVDRTRLEDSLLASLSAPHFVRRLARASASQADAELAKRIAGAVSRTVIEFADEPDGGWLGEIVDLAPGRPIVRADALDLLEAGDDWTANGNMRGPQDDGYSEALPLMSTFRRGSLHADASEVERVIADLLVDPAVSLADPADDIVRVQLIDPALYAALLEHPELLRVLDWRLFEELLADILKRLGYEVELQQGTKDGGVDLFAVKKEDPMGVQRFLLQAKRWSHKVGVEPVRQLLFLHSHHKVTKACLATTASFTAGAWELARQYRWQLELRELDGLMQWIRLAKDGRAPAIGPPNRRLQPSAPPAIMKRRG